MHAAAKQSHVLDDIKSEHSEEFHNESSLIKLDSSQDYFEDCKSSAVEHFSSEESSDSDNDDEALLV